MLCPACHEEIDGYGRIFWHHLASCGVECGGRGEVICACGVKMPNTSMGSFIEHLNEPHDWPKDITRSTMENM